VQTSARWPFLGGRVAIKPLRDLAVELLPLGSHGAPWPGTRARIAHMTDTPRKVEKTEEQWQDQLNQVRLRHGLAELLGADER
jgi:hypothetical protein